jgi:hypothetical protein
MAHCALGSEEVGMRSIVGLLAVFAASCVSTATETARSAAEREIALRQPDGGGSMSSQSAPPANGCEDIATRIAEAHPAPLAALARARASLRRSHAAASAPGPTFWLEVWDFPIGDPTLAGREGMYMVGVRQEIPVLAALDAEGRSEAELSRAESAEGRDVSRLLFLEAGRGCVDWIVAGEVAKRWREYGTHLSQVREATATAYGAGSGTTSLGSIARVDADIARVERRAIELEEQAHVARDGLVALAGEGVALPEEAPALPEPPRELDLEPTIAGALSVRGDVAAARFRAAAADARAESARAMADVPKFEVAATYMQMPGARPGLGAMVSMTMPWIGGGLLDASDAAEEEAKASVQQTAAVERAAVVEVRQQASKLRAAQLTLVALEERELPAAERAAKAERAGLLSGGFDLTAWLLASRMALEARIERELMRGAVARAWLELQGATGSGVTENDR